MKLYVVRHGEAEEAGAGGDEGRRLTPEGIRKIKEAARGLESFGISVRSLLSSPLPRAWQTAEIIGERLGVTPERSDALVPGQSIRKVLYRLSTLPPASSVMVVGHQPTLSELIGACIGVSGGAIEMKKGACCCIEFSGPMEEGSGVLQFLLRNRHLRGF